MSRVLRCGQEPAGIGTMKTNRPSNLDETVEIRLLGTVQGVGFRPTVWRLAHDAGLTGEVLNEGGGVLIRTTGDRDAISKFVDDLQSEAPPLSRIEAVQTRRLSGTVNFAGFRISESGPAVGSLQDPKQIGELRSDITPDAATCEACRQEVLDPSQRRHGYPFVNCTHCGPRFSIVRRIPYDRANTTMAEFSLCELCGDEYDDPKNRRFHAQPIACPVCGPRVWIETLEQDGAGQRVTSDAIGDAVARLRNGQTVAIRGLGGFHLACDATNAGAVDRLRIRKRRDAKPFALMARDLEVIRRYCVVSRCEQELLESAEAPIVLLKPHERRLPPGIAPGLDLLGFMLPYTPLHLLIMQHFDQPLVMTSGNVSNQPQVTGNRDARAKLHQIADAALMHDRDIANRIDDSVIRVMAAKPRMLRRARGYAPAPIALPAGFEFAPELLAYGAELKSTFCLLSHGAAVLSQHQGDLEDAATLDDFQKNLRLYEKMYDHRPRLLAADLHPEYLSSKLAAERAVEQSLPLVQIQHHHAHIASCLAENGIGLDAPPVLGIVLDGLGLGDDGQLWGGEFMIADYCRFDRVATLQPVAMIGGAQAVRQPWRNTYAHLVESMGWQPFMRRFGMLELCRDLKSKPLEMMDRMLQMQINVPPASSCGRLFDAVAAAVGICHDHALFEGQAAMEFESVAQSWLSQQAPPAGYSFASIQQPDSGLVEIDPSQMWQELLEDLSSGCPRGRIAARFHFGLAKTISELTLKIVCNKKLHRSPRPIQHVVLSGGCFQNKLLLEETARLVGAGGIACLLHARVPANDGGIALGQAVIAAAQRIKQTNKCESANGEVDQRCV